MISLPDFKEKQVLFVNPAQEPGTHLRFLNDNIVFEREGQVSNRVSVHRAFAIFIVGNLTLTTNFLNKAKEYGVSVFLLKSNFEVYGALCSVAEGHYMLRERQYGLTSDREFIMAKTLVKNKLENQRRAILARGMPSEERMQIHEYFAKNIGLIASIKANEELLGLEGNCARYYFKHKFCQMGWKRRAPRTKEDINNFLLDWGYSLLFNFVDSLLRLHGFDTFKGFYHKLFFARRSLACDLIEPFRPLIDTAVVKMHNLNRINKKDFQFCNGQYILSPRRRAHYSQIFLQCLMDSREDIYNYIHGYYRYMMSDGEVDFPEYKFRLN